MIPTVLKPIRTQIKKDEFEPWINKELLPFMAQVRQALNYTAIQSPPVFTTFGSGGFETIWTSADIAVGSAVRLDADVMAVTDTARSTFTITGLFYNDATTAQEGSTVAVVTIDSAGFEVRYLVVSNHVELQVRDNGGLTVDWQAVVEAQEVS